jgi:hypothetical protein
MQVVAALNPIAGEKMQEDLEGRITALQSELERAHCEVHLCCGLASTTQCWILLYFWDVLLGGGGYSVCYKYFNILQ